MHSQLHIAAKQHIADLHRAAGHSRLVHTAASSDAVPAPHHPSVVPALGPPPPGLHHRKRIATS
jgi:hypothetical protein